jgi:hypothetical protein
MDALITDFLSKVRVGSPKPSRRHSYAVNDRCQECNFFGTAVNWTQIDARRFGMVYIRVYIRGCQEHFSPSAGGAGLIRDIQPLTVEDARVAWCPWVNPSQQLHLRE